MTDYTELLEELTDPMKFTWGSRTKAANAIRELQEQVKEYEALVLNIHGALGGCFIADSLQLHIRTEFERIEATEKGK